MTLDLRIAGCDFRVTHAAAEERWVDLRYGAFRAPVSDPFRLEISYVENGFTEQPAGVEYPGFQAIRRSDGTLAFLRRGGSLEVDPVRRTARAVHARLAPDAGTFTEHPTSLDPFLRVLLTLELTAKGGLLLHASGGIVDGRAYLFAAESGGGKTTTSRKLPPDSVLSDDQVAITHENGWIAHATPFVGMLGRPMRPQSAPIAAIALLEKSARPTARRLRPAEAASRLLGCVVQHVPDAAQGPAFDRTLSLISGVPTYALAVAADTPFDEIQRLLNG